MLRSGWARLYVVAAVLLELFLVGSYLFTFTCESDALTGGHMCAPSIPELHEYRIGFGIASVVVPIFSFIALLVAQWVCAGFRKED